jgi:hypothetical protein
MAGRAVTSQAAAIDVMREPRRGRPMWSQAPAGRSKERWIVQLADEDERIGWLLGVPLMTYSAMTCPITP